MLNVLFLCTHNSARSILSEALLNHLDRRSPARRFQAWSAGTRPRCALCCSDPSAGVRQTMSRPGVPTL
jgi:arsenate reductase